jgi:hypothetical protein
LNLADNRPEDEKRVEAEFLDRLEADRTHTRRDRPVW